MSGEIGDAIDAGENAAKGAIERTGAGAEIAKGAAAGAAEGTAIASGIVLAGTVATEAAAIAGATGISAALATAGTALGTAATTIGAGLAIGSAIPIPVLGSAIGLVIGAVVAAVQAIVRFFNNRPPKEVAIELLAVFRTYPNVLRDWIASRDDNGIDLSHTVLRSRWGYLAMLREQAGEKGPDPFEDPAWREAFEAGTVEPALPKRAPRLSVLGIHATAAEAATVAGMINAVHMPGLDVEAHPVKAGALADVAGVQATAGIVVHYPDVPGGPAPGYQPGAESPRQGLHVYKDGHTPVFLIGKPLFMIIVPTAESASTPAEARQVLAYWRKAPPVNTPETSAQYDRLRLLGGKAAMDPALGAVFPQAMAPLSFAAAPARAQRDPPPPKAASPAPGALGPWEPGISGTIGGAHGTVDASGRWHADGAPVAAAPPIPAPAAPAAALPVPGSPFAFFGAPAAPASDVAPPADLSGASPFSFFSSR
jgi:hypothetical protein